MKDKKALTLKTLNKSNVWELQENDIFRLWEAGEKDADLKDNIRHYNDIIKSAFEMEEVLLVVSVFASCVNVASAAPTSLNLTVIFPVPAVILT